MSNINLTILSEGIQTIINNRRRAHAREKDPNKKVAIMNDINRLVSTRDKLEKEKKK